ncbi:lytic transglycosylase domain-containing protein [Solicola sp. PLA-1-18]|uniref:lytic transglycosylase domain-containing protein n=1 Tax=Solicola sp. PLA-1-18 TaxID=3380532 RepID=UPI003B821985
MRSVLTVGLVAAVAAALLATTRLADRGGVVDDPVVVTSAPADVEAPVPSVDVAAADPAAVVDPAWVQSTAASTAVPVPAVRAYASAALRLAREQPGCGLGWTTLAGIGWVESHHGTIGGRTLADDGTTGLPIDGVALDGDGDVAAIGDGNGSWDRAAGPMQFISTTWRRWASDGDGDGRTDVHDLDDAAYAAGRYLCADDHRLDGALWGQAVFSYNHSAEYVAAVHAAADQYAAATSSSGR